jgi:hypothetical protein
MRPAARWSDVATPNQTPEQIGVLGYGNVVAFRLFIEVPTRPAEVAKRHHNRFAKVAMREVLEYHHKHHIPLHYKGESSKTRYNYHPRSPAYERAKQRKYHHKYPLVYSGDTAKMHKRPGGYKSLRVGGAAEGGKRAIQGILEYVFSFTAKVAAHMRQKFQAASGKGKSAAARMRAENRKQRRTMLLQDARRRGVTIGQMRKELEQMHPDEVRKLAEVYLASYLRQYNAWEGGRKRKRLPTK